MRHLKIFEDELSDFSKDIFGLNSFFKLQIADIYGKVLAKEALDTFIQSLINAGYEVSVNEEFARSYPDSYLMKIKILGQIGLSDLIKLYPEKITIDVKNMVKFMVTVNRNGEESKRFDLPDRRWPDRRWLAWEPNIGIYIMIPGILI